MVFKKMYSRKYRLKVRCFLFIDYSMNIIKQY